MLASGSLKERAKIERFIRTDTDDGSWSEEWVTVVDPLYCNVQEKTASVDVVASQSNMIKPVYFLCRFRSDMPFRIGDRIVWRGRYFKLDSFTVDQNRTQILIIGHTEDETTAMDASVPVDSISPLTINSMPATDDKPTIVLWT